MHFCIIHDDRRFSKDQILTNNMLIGFFIHYTAFVMSNSHTRCLKEVTFYMNRGNKTCMFCSRFSSRGQCVNVGGRRVRTDPCSSSTVSGPAPGMCVSIQQCVRKYRNRSDFCGCLCVCVYANKISMLYMPSLCGLCE